MELHNWIMVSYNFAASSPLPLFTTGQDKKINKLYFAKMACILCLSFQSVLVWYYRKISDVSLDTTDVARLFYQTKFQSSLHENKWYKFLTHCGHVTHKEANSGGI